MNNMDDAIDMVNDCWRRKHRLNERDYELVQELVHAEPEILYANYSRLEAAWLRATEEG